jgi:ribosomal protein L11 methyltransferase
LLCSKKWSEIRRYTNGHRIFITSNAATLTNLAIAVVPNWLKITVVTERESATRLCEALDTLGAFAVTVESAECELDCDEFMPGPPNWRRQAVSGLFDGDADSTSMIAVLCQIAGSNAPITTKYLPNRNWVLDGQQAFQPLQISENLRICPVWHPAQTFDGQTVWIKPGLAFGTGKHPSTALCLERLATLQLTDTAVLDWGCGSGILAVAALKLGASTALGVDIDHRALVASRELAAENLVDEGLVVCGPDEVPYDFRCQLIMANLLARTLIYLAPTLGHHLSDDGELLVSGILEDQATDIVSAFGPGYAFDTVSREGWAMIIVTRQ